MQRDSLEVSSETNDHGSCIICLVGFGRIDPHRWRYKWHDDVTRRHHALAAAGSLYGCLAYLKRLESELLNDSDAIFDRLFIGREKSLDLQLRWRNIVKPELLDLASSSATAGRGVITSLPTLSLWGQKSISSILKNDIPRLRLRVAEYKNTHHIRGGKHPGSTYSGNR
ncbi:hypothetical protein C4B63_76g55 [Trypanosoma cruzi]|uniref:Uncharacterized protein n=1 Tax=Trypanosoma cruzi TaxID=5693 RepID=A0A2V2V1P5_TRYCR|nr:hypothetical protein C4B63_76g55 [Trypanosoma cruzi]